MKGHARTRRKPKETEGNETGLGLRLLVTRLRRMGVGHNLVGTRPRQREWSRPRVRSAPDERLYA
jgi:hypothetical protein